MTRCLSLKAMAMAYSATTVFPADVCAATSTDSLRSCKAPYTKHMGSTHQQKKLLLCLYAVSQTSSLRLWSAVLLCPIQSWHPVLQDGAGKTVLVLALHRLPASGWVPGFNTSIVGLFSASLCFSCIQGTRHVYTTA